MSKESLEQLVKEEFPKPGPTQDSLKTTDSFDDFVNLMVSLGNPKYSFTAEEVKAFVQDEMDRLKKTLIQDKADQDKATIEKEDLDAVTKAKLVAENQAAADKRKKEEIDDVVVTRWKVARFVEITIVNLKGNANVLPIP